MKNLIIALLVATNIGCSSTEPVRDNCSVYNFVPPSWVSNMVFEHGYGASPEEAEENAKSALAKRVVTDVVYRLDARDGEIVRHNMTVTSNVRFQNITVETLPNPTYGGCWVSWVGVTPSEADILMARQWATDAMESLDWVKVSRSSDIWEVRKFMETYPGGQHYHMAEQKLEEMLRKENKEIIGVSVWLATMAALAIGK